MDARHSHRNPDSSSSHSYRYARTPRGEAKGQAPAAGPPPPDEAFSKAVAEGQERHRQERRKRDRLTAVVAFTALLQVLGTADVVSWTPGIFLHGGLERFVHWGAAQGWAAAGWASKAGQVVFCIYWVGLALACSRLAAEAVPMGRFPAEFSYVLVQRRVAYLAPLVVLLAGHLVGAWVAAHLHWLLAVPFELGGHVGMAALLYLILAPEARCALVIVVDRAQKGLNNRVHFTGRVRTLDRRWASVTHHRVRQVTARAPLLARLLGSAHMEITYLDAWNGLRTEELKYMDSKTKVAEWTSFLNGPFHSNNATTYDLPPNYQVPGGPPGSNPY